MSTLFNVWKVDGTYEPLDRTTRPLYAPTQISAPEKVWPFSWAFEKVVNKKNPSLMDLAKLKEKRIQIKEDGKQHKSPNQGSEQEEASKQNEPTPLIACQVMSSPVATLTTKTSLKEAWNLFQKTRFRHIPVVTTDKEGKETICGIISDRSLLYQGLWHLKNPGKISPSSYTIDQFMVKEVVTALERTPVFEIAHLLLTHKIGCMPICSLDGELMGIITRSDLLRLAARTVLPLKH